MKEVSTGHHRHCHLGLDCILSLIIEHSSGLSVPSFCHSLNIVCDYSPLGPQPPAQFIAMSALHVGKMIDIYIFYLKIY